MKANASLSPQPSSAPHPAHPVAELMPRSALSPAAHRTTHAVPAAGVVGEVASTHPADLLVTASLRRLAHEDLTEHLLCARGSANTVSLHPHDGPRKQELEFPSSRGSH